MSVKKFENLISEYFNSKYAVAVDCCTHAVELCLRLLNSDKVTCPNRTYLSIPMTFQKLGIDWSFRNEEWSGYYYIGNTPIIDAAVLWGENSYIDGTYMCLSFQFKKHLNLGRGGMILLDDYNSYIKLKKMRYDGRLDDIPWAEQDVDTLGYHYYMTPETAEIGIFKFNEVLKNNPRKWSYLDYPELNNKQIFKDIKDKK